MKKIILYFVIALSTVQLYAQAPAPNPFFSLMPTGNWMQSKNYYLLSLLEQDPTVSQQIKSDAKLAELTQKKIADLNNSITACKDATCFTSSLKFSDDDINTVGDRLTKLCTPGSALARLVKTKLIPSYTYSLYKNLSPE